MKNAGRKIKDNKEFLGVRAKKVPKNFGGSGKSRTFAPAIQNEAV
jgi:hypothetical protein